MNQNFTLAVVCWMTLSIMIFRKRSYRWPDAREKMWMVSLSSSGGGQLGRGGGGGGVAVVAAVEEGGEEAGVLVARHLQQLRLLLSFYALHEDALVRVGEAHHAQLRCAEFRRSWRSLSVGCSS